MPNMECGEISNSYIEDSPRGRIESVNPNNNWLRAFESIHINDVITDSIDIYDSIEMSSESSKISNISVIPSVVAINGDSSKTTVDNGDVITYQLEVENIGKMRQTGVSVIKTWIVKILMIKKEMLSFIVILHCLQNLR